MNRNGQDESRRWLKRTTPRGPVETRLLCFHYAGGSAAMYRDWPRLMPRGIEPIAVQLPGRADRFTEPPYDRMAPLVDKLIEVIKPLLDQPFACYGVSMGARVAWALAHTLRERAMPMPRKLFVAASAAPCSDEGTRRWEGRADGLEGYVREMGGTPAEVLAEPELLAALLPTLRADLTVLSTHGLHPATPLDVPIRAFAGVDDDEAPPDRMSGWSIETGDGLFELTPLRCGHFFDVGSEREVIRIVADDLRPGTPR
jgi:surfactin synthase thioesterase subunit